MKRIALTQRLLKNQSYFEIREALDINWGKFFAALDFEPVVLPLQYDFKKLEFQGAVLTGGNSIYEVSHDRVDKTRDEFESALLDYCVNKNIPVLGICRGMQFINHYFGGTLKRVENHAGTTHKLDSGRLVNSYHEWAIDKVGNGLEAAARAEDGTVEVVKHKSFKIYASMAHPERCEPFDVYDIDLFKSFFRSEI